MGHGIEHVARQLTTRKCRNRTLKPSRCIDRATQRPPRRASSSLEGISSSAHVNVMLLLIVLLDTPRRSRYCYFTRWPNIRRTVWIANFHQYHLGRKQSCERFSSPLSKERTAWSRLYTTFAASIAIFLRFNLQPRENEATTLFTTISISWSWELLIRLLSLLTTPGSLESI